MSSTRDTTLPVLNHQFTLAARPVGVPKPSDFRLVESRIPPVEKDQVLVRSLFLSVDPYMRGRISGVKSYADPYDVGQVVLGGAVGEILQANTSKFQPGEIVQGMWGWQEFAVLDAERVRKVDTSQLPVSTALGVLGMPGMTAYFGLLEICKPQRGETVVVSGAAGAVGSLVGQIAKIAGCRVVGIAGSDDKVEWLTQELGFDAAFNYKSVGDYLARLKELCPSGVDCYFDNVGGSITDAVFLVLNTKARVSICGQISQYNETGAPTGSRILQQLLWKQARAEGFLVYQFQKRWPEGISQMAQWIREGKVRYREHVVEGFHNTPQAFIGMLRGENSGKMIVKVAD
jgi:NADPH-dependent curcumin reductase CurA